MNPKKGLVGKDLKPAPPGAGKPGMSKPDLKPSLGAKGNLAKELPTKGAASRNLLSLEDVSERGASQGFTPGHPALRTGEVPGQASSRHPDGPKLSCPGRRQINFQRQQKPGQKASQRGINACRELSRKSPQKALIGAIPFSVGRRSDQKSVFPGTLRFQARKSGSLCPTSSP